MIRLYAYVGEVSEEQFDFLMDKLEEESLDDHDYYLNKPMIEMLQSGGADNELVGLLNRALAGKEDVEILWVDTEAEDGEYEDEDEQEDR